MIHLVGIIYLASYRLSSHLSIFIIGLPWDLSW